MIFFYLKAILGGKLMSTSKYEAKSEQIKSDLIRYSQLKDSDKWKEFQELEAKVQSAEFKGKKKEIDGTSYKSTKEYKTWIKYQKSCKDKYVKKYLKKGEEEGRSSVQNYLALKQEVESEEFQKRKAFWEDKHRWLTTEEGMMEAKYEALKKDEDIVFMQHVDMAAIEDCSKLELIYEDQFKWNGLKNSDWKPGFIYPNEHFVNVHSYMNEKQAFTGGKNIETSAEGLSIQTRKEPCEAAAWDNKKGMVKKQFAYTSDAVYLDKVAIEPGQLVQVKVRCRGMLNHGIYLRSKNHVPFISLFDYTGFKLYCGVKDSIQHDKNLKRISGFQPISYTIFTVSWKDNEIVWYLNNMEVYRTKNMIAKGEKLYLHLYSFLFEKSRYAGEGSLDVEWVRIYKQK